MRAQGLLWLPVMVLLVSLPHSFLLDMDTFIIDYSSRSLSAVPPDLPPMTQYLDLSRNRLWTLRKYDFQGTPRLHFLNLSWNILEDIHPDTFTSTPLLATLDLSHNSLEKLSHQQYLLQAQNLQYMDLSSNLFAVMALGSEFSKLTKLKWLGLSARFIQNNNFANISHLQLQTLFIQAQNLKGYEKGSLKGARSEKIIVLMPHRKFYFPIIVDTLTSIKDVELRGLYDPEDFLGILVSRKICIQTVNLRLSSIWSTLKVITSLTNSALKSSIHQFSVFNLTLHCMQEPYAVIQDHSLDSFSIRQASVTVFLFNQQLIYDFFISIPARNLTFAQTPIVHMTCPKNVSIIQMLDLSDCVVTERIFSSEERGECRTLINLEILILKGNNLRQLMPLTSRVQLMSSLRHVDLSQNLLTYEETQGRCTWPSKITHLDLSSNDFDQTVFKCLPNTLVNLNLQNNHISSIPANISVLSLKFLDLTSNRLLDLPDCLGYPNLQKLLLRGNFIHTPSTGSLKTCSHLTVVDISMNPYICTCPLREFTNHIDDKGSLGGSNSWKKRITMAHWPDGYHCSYPAYWRTALLKNFRMLEITCSVGLLGVTILIPAISLVIFLGILCQQLDLPWYTSMIWKWAQAKHRALRTQQQSENLQGVCFHAFISYSQRNASWVIHQLLPKLEGEDSTNRKQLRVCYHERDFIPGRPIIDNILRCIEQSRCCVFVLSSHFVQSDWCNYELYFASHQWITRGMDNIILILLEPLPTYLIPSKYCQLKAMMARRTYLEWPQDKAKQRMFWANLRAVLQADLPDSVERE